VILAGLMGHRSSSTSSTFIGSYSARTRQPRPRAVRPLCHAGAEAPSGVPTSLWAHGRFVYGQRQRAVGKRHFADPILHEHPVAMSTLSVRLLSPKPGVPVKLAKTLGQLGVALLSLPLAVPAAADPAPSSASQHAQWIVVGVPAATATTGTLTAFQRVGQQWKVVLGPTPAKVGELGVGAPADGVHRTPVGTFTFDQAFGRQPDPGTKMPYFQATDQDWWDEDAGSPTYNTHVRGSGSPSSIAENLYDSGPVYDYAVNVAVNPQRIPGRVAGIFLHVTDGNPTWGCVAIGRDEMRSVLNWLDPSVSPQITIGVGNPSLVSSGS
jgi:L,D-peptidoglycan transpeptidase YkuD (ErfK/YbiS/YcfS/YnhG family)